MGKNKSFIVAFLALFFVCSKAFVFNPLRSTSRFIFSRLSDAAKSQTVDLSLKVQGSINGLPVSFDIFSNQMTAAGTAEEGRTISTVSPTDEHKKKVHSDVSYGRENISTSEPIAPKLKTVHVNFTDNCMLLTGIPQHFNSDDIDNFVSGRVFEAFQPRFNYFVQNLYKNSLLFIEHTGAAYDDAFDKAMNTTEYLSPYVVNEGCWELIKSVSLIMDTPYKHKGSRSFS